MNTLSLYVKTIGFICITVILWQITELYVLESLVLQFVQTFLDLFTSLQLQIEHTKSSVGYIISSGIFKPQQAYTIGKVYPALSLQGKTSIPIPTFLNLFIGVPVYIVFEFLTYKKTRNVNLKEHLANIFTIIVFILIAILLLVFFKITQIAPSPGDFLVQDNQGRVLEPITFNRMTSDIVKVLTDFAGIFASFLLPCFLSAKKRLHLFNGK